MARGVCMAGGMRGRGACMAGRAWHAHTPADTTGYGQ